MIQKITIFDFILLPVYLFIFYFFVKKKVNGIEEPDMKRFFLTAFALRMLGSIAYCLLVQYYYGYGDSFTYYEGSDFLHIKITENLSNIKYLFVNTKDLQQWFSMESDDKNLYGFIGIPSSAAVMKISAIFSFLSFNKFMIISLFFGLFSFSGQWKLFQVFNDYNKGKNSHLLAYAVLYSPSIWFWGSGLMKDSICIGAIGFIISIVYYNVVKKEIRFGQWPILFLLVFIVYTVKNYIVIVALASVIIVLFTKYVLQLKNVLSRIALILLFLFVIISILSFADFSSQIQMLVDESLSQVKTFQTQYQSIQIQDESSKAGFDLGNVNESMSGLLLKSPFAIFTCLYRPFLWESHKVIIFLTALESNFMLLVTIYLLFKTRITGFFSIIFSNYLYLFSFLLSILFALIIGFTTFNFGSIARYKIILLPFYYFMLVGIYTNYSARKAAKENVS